MVIKALGQALARIRFGAPAPADVVVFSQHGSDVISRMLLWDIPHQILDTAPPRIFLSARLLVRLMVRAISIHEPNPFAGSKRLRFRLGLLLRIYLLACLDVMKPRLVITFVDNDYAFQWASRRLPGTAFFAVQNGTRLPYDVSSWLPPAPHPAHHMSMPHFFCFGEHVRDLYTRFGHDIDHYHPVGSVRSSFYRSRLSAPTGQQVYDLCLISQWTADLDRPDGPLPEIRRSLGILHNYVRRFASERELRLCIALRSSDSRESRFFAEFFGPSAIIIPNDRVRMSTYAAIESSGTALTMDSTVGWEAFGWGHKVLFCNCSDHENYNFPSAGPWSIEHCDYEQFKMKLDELRHMDNAAYYAQSRPAAKYVMNHTDDGRTIETIRSAIRNTGARWI